MPRGQGEGSEIRLRVEVVEIPGEGISKGNFPKLLS
jgi:hypothetical protein